MTGTITICETCNIHLYKKDIEENKCIACGVEVIA